MAAQGPASSFRVFVASDAAGGAAKAVRVVRDEPLAAILRRVGKRLGAPGEAAAHAASGRLTLVTKGGQRVEVDGADDLEPDDSLIFHPPPQAAPAPAACLTTTGKRSKNSAASPAASPAAAAAAAAAASPAAASAACLTTTGKRSKNTSSVPAVNRHAPPAQALPRGSGSAGVACSDSGESTDADSDDEEDDEEEDDEEEEEEEDAEEEILRALQEAEEEERGRAKRQPRPTIEAFLDPSDVPVERGGPAADADVAGGGSAAGEDDAGLGRIKARIAKMLALGLHAGTSEAEAQQSMRQAQRLLSKYNLDQATILNESSGGAGLKDQGAMAGGMAKVELFKAGTKDPAKLDRTAEGLALCCAKNFEVRYFKRRSRRSTQLVFYGLRSGAQLAAYAFSVAFVRVHLMQKAYKPPAGEYELKKARGQTQCTAGSYTATARRNYADGLVHGLHSAVISALEQRVQRRTAKLRRAQRRAERWRKACERGMHDGKEAAAQTAAHHRGGEAYDEDDDDEGQGEGMHGGDDDMSGTSSDDDDGGGGGDSSYSFEQDDDDDDDAKGETRRDDSAGKGAVGGQGADQVEDKLAAAELQLAKLHRSSAAAQALVVHTAAVSDTVLKDAGVKLKGGRKRKALVEHNAAAWAQGKRDAKQIDLNQNSVGDRK